MRISHHLDQLLQRQITHTSHRHLLQFCHVRLPMIPSAFADPAESEPLPSRHNRSERSAASPAASQDLCVATVIMMEQDGAALVHCQCHRTAHRLFHIRTIAAGRLINAPLYPSHSPFQRRALASPGTLLLRTSTLSQGRAKPIDLPARRDLSRQSKKIADMGSDKQATPALLPCKQR
jgi:hypothetical protein